MLPVTAPGDTSAINYVARISMSERPRRRSQGRSTSGVERLALAGAIGLVLALLGGAWLAADMMSALSDQVTESTYLANTINRFEAVMAKAAEAETEQRAYLQNADDKRLKAFHEAVAAMRTEFDELFKATAGEPSLNADIGAARAMTDKAVDSVRDAIDYQRIGQAPHGNAIIQQSGSISGTVKETIGPLHAKFEAALVQSRNRPREVASNTATWLVATWLLAAALGVTLAVLAIRQARAVGRMHRRLRDESIYDGLTGLPNGVYLEEWLSRSLHRAVRTGAKVGLLFVDINNFKQVNHALGHGEGDRVLTEIAGKLTSVTRASDFVARVRNDSFAVVMADVLDLQEIESAMSRLVDLSVDRAGIAIKTTVGAAVFPEDAETADNLLRLSRAAMYRNRQTRRAA